MLHVSVALLPKLLPETWAKDDAIAIVIDTLRFTSTACVALSAGAESVTVVSDIEQARRLAHTVEGTERGWLCGERHCVRIPGFDLGNSPAEYKTEVVAGRQLIFSTTNGTFAVEAVEAARHVALAALINREATAHWAVQEHKRTKPQPTGPQTGPGDSPLWIVCAGTDGDVASEDVLTAGAILECLRNLDQLSIDNDSAWLALDAWRSTVQQNNLVQRLTAARGGRNLIEAGFGGDVDFAANIDSLKCVPVQIAPRTFALL